MSAATVVVNRFGLLELDVSDRDLRDLPAAVFAVVRLEVLRAARNRLGAVSSDVSALRRLRLLDVGHNELAALPDALSNCVRLAELDARGNRLTTLPARLPAALAHSLRTLRLAGNRSHTRSTQPCIPPGSLNRVPASAGVRAGMSPLPGGR